MDPKLASLSLGFVNVSSLALRKAADELADRHALAEKAGPVRTDLLAYMERTGLAEKRGTDNYKATEAMLADHASTTALLKQACETVVALRNELAKVATKSAADPGFASGRPAAPPQAAPANGQPRPSVVGGRSSRRKESDDVLATIMHAPI